MKPPHGVLKPGKEGKVCCLLKALYSLKQASRVWHQELMRVLVTDLGFNQSAVDHSVFLKQTVDEHTVVTMAMDNTAITSKQLVDVKRFKTELCHYWGISDKGELSWFIGFKVKHDRQACTILINQWAYIEAMVNKFKLTNAKLVLTPMEAGVQYMKEQGPSTPTQERQVQGVPYSEAIGCVLWLVVISHPNVVFAIEILLQFIQNPGLVNWEALKQVIVYLGSMKDLWLTIGRKSQKLVEGFCDTDWATQKHWHLILGYSYHLGQGAVIWSSKKQQIIALSTVEAECIAQAHAAKEVLWLCTFISEIQGESEPLIMIYSDNQGAIALSKDNKFHTRMKHIDIHHHFIHKVIKDKKVSVVCVLTDENPADIFTKPLAKIKFHQFIELLGLWRVEMKEGGRPG